MSYPETYDLDGEPVAKLAKGTAIYSSDQVTALLQAHAAVGRVLTEEESATVLQGGQLEPPTTLSIGDEADLEMPFDAVETIQVIWKNPTRK
jgi:hypothetical protein